MIFTGALAFLKGVFIMTTLYDLFPKKDGMYADELTYNLSTGSYYLLYFDLDANDGEGAFVEYYISRQDIREAKKAYDSETDEIKKRTAFISSISENCATWWAGNDDADFEDYVHTYVHNVYTAIATSTCIIFFGLSTDEEHLVLDEADKFICVLMNGIKEDEE